MKRLAIAVVAVLVVLAIAGATLVWYTHRNTIPKGKAEVTGLRSRSGAVAFRNVGANVISSPVIVTVNTSEDGKFSERLPAGQYEVSGTNDGDCTPIDLTLKSGAKQNITLTCSK